MRKNVSLSNLRLEEVFDTTSDFVSFGNQSALEVDVFFEAPKTSAFSWLFNNSPLDPYSMSSGAPLPTKAFGDEPWAAPALAQEAAASDRSLHSSAGGIPTGVDDITVIESAFDAKGGKPGRGGGGSGGGSDGGDGSGGTATQYLSGAQNGTDGYDILIEFIGTGWTIELQNAFKNSADYLTQVITYDIGGNGVYLGKTIDDLYITAELKTIDGQGGILGQAGPTALWTATELTAAGQMQFDSADATNYLSQGLWDDIVMHEMMHVLGVGSLWTYGNNPLVSNSQYIGVNAITAYNEIVPGSSYIPVENDGGPGTAGAHWDEQALGNELMTGYINTDFNASTSTDNYLSKFSVMSLADLGYRIGYVDYPYDSTPIV